MPSSWLPDRYPSRAWSSPEAILRPADILFVDHQSHPRCPRRGRADTGARKNAAYALMPAVVEPLGRYRGAVNEPEALPPPRDWARSVRRVREMLGRLTCDKRPCGVPHLLGEDIGLILHGSDSATS